MTRVDPELIPGARNAIETCLRIQPDEKTTLITDRACSEIGAALAQELNRKALRYSEFILEDLAPRPLVEMPRAVLDDMETSDVSIFAVKAQANELRTRMQMTDVVNRRKMRHAHMVNIDRRIMLEGMRADFEEVDRISTQVWQLAGAAREIRATNPAGTDILGRFSSELKWLKTSGIISPQQVGQPAGRRDVYHAGAGGRHFRDRRRGGRLPVRKVRRPARQSADHSWWRAAACGRPTAPTKRWRRSSGSIATPTKTATAWASSPSAPTSRVHDVIGNILQDEKIPGIHIAFGNPYGAHTGADWYSSTHIDVVGRKFDVWIDGRQIMHSGAFLLDSLTPPVV